MQKKLMIEKIKYIRRRGELIQRTRPTDEGELTCYTCEYWERTWKDRKVGRCDKADYEHPEVKYKPQHFGVIDEGFDNRPITGYLFGCVLHHKRLKMIQCVDCGKDLVPGGNRFCKTCWAKLFKEK